MKAKTPLRIVIVGLAIFFSGIIPDAILVRDGSMVMLGWMIGVIIMGIGVYLQLNIIPSDLENNKNPTKR